MKNHIHEYQELSFHPFRRVRGVCYNEGFWRDTIKDAALALIRISRRVFNWIKKNYRKEFFVSLVFLLALLPEPRQVKAIVTPATPAYIQPVPRLEPVVAVSFPVPDEVSPVAIPEPVVAPPVAPVAIAPAPISDSCVTGYSSGDYYLDKIISFESSGNSCITNYLGCFGLLQACPGEPLRAACGGSPTCQIAWFQTNKTGGRSWAQVWQHELDFGWW